jgi:hypothetical protein
MADLRTTSGNGKKAAAKPAAKKAAASNRAARVDTRSRVTPEERQKMIAEAAYLRAERRGFMGGDPTEDWLNAEAEIDQILSRT